MKENTILVLTATLGNRATLSKTIESVKTIGGNAVHHVLVCPSSEILKLQADYMGIDCIPEPSDNKGIYGALNHGFNLLGHDYKYLTFINDDDFWLPDYRYLINELSYDFDIVYGRNQFVDVDGSYVSTQPASKRFRDYLPLYRHNVTLMTQQSAIFKSALFFKFGGFDESYKIVADTKFWIQVSLEKELKWKYVNKVCSAYMLQDGQISSDNVMMQNDFRKLKGEFSKIGGNGLYELFLFRLSNIFVYIKRLLK